MPKIYKLYKPPHRDLVCEMTNQEMKIGSIIVKSKEIVQMWFVHFSYLRTLI